MNALKKRSNQPAGLGRGRLSGASSTFGYVVAREDTTAAVGLAYWAVVTHLFAAWDVGLAAAAGSTALLLAAIGALEILLLLQAEIGPIEVAEERRVIFTRMAIAGFVVLILAKA